MRANVWSTYMREPEESICNECYEVKPHEGGEHDVADYPDGDEDGRMRPVFICADCLNPVVIELKAEITELQALAESWRLINETNVHLVEFWRNQVVPDGQVTVYAEPAGDGQLHD